MGSKLREIIRRVQEPRSGPSLHRAFFTDLVKKTDNFSGVTWLGQPIWQNVFDLWTHPGDALRDQAGPADRDAGRIAAARPSSTPTSST